MTRIPTYIYITIELLLSLSYNNKPIVRRRFAGHHHEHGGQPGLSGRLRTHAGHAHMLRSVGERQVPQPDDAVLRGTTPVTGQRYDGRQQSGPDHVAAGDGVQRPTTSKRI